MMPLRRCSWRPGPAALFGSVDELLRVPLPPAARAAPRRRRIGRGRRGPGLPDEATDGAELAPKGSEKALEVEGAGAGADLFRLEAPRHLLVGLLGL